MVLFVATLAVASCTREAAVAALHLEPEAASDPEIRAFLTDPKTTIFAADGLHWSRKREYLYRAMPVKGGCRYNFSGSTSLPTDPQHRRLIEELAVNRRSCVSLIRDGQLDERSSAQLNRRDAREMRDSFRGTSDSLRRSDLPPDQ
ncbi:hypothetical protein [Solimonas marina]|uniref:Uncharacterized protein n=1 Tax=Solimonas marina TaxID=2714601 RepID=A0A969WAS6_9GAMM|nr:hypothetical protein [Solimonas marina]NKF21465.1 hypothetical protein [Solimonas marina]